MTDEKHPLKVHAGYAPAERTGQELAPLVDVYETQGGLTILDLPIGQWVHFVIGADLGADNSGLWTLVVTLPGQEPKTFAKLKNENAATFEQITWLGFVSNATAPTVFYLDNLKIENRP